MHRVATDAAGNPLDFDGDSLPDWYEDRDGDGVFDAAAGESDWQNAYNSTNGLNDLQNWELASNVLVNDPMQDIGNEQNTQFESTCAVLNGNIIVAYVDSNAGVYGLGGEPLLANRTNRLVAYSFSRDGGVTFTDQGVPPVNTHGTTTTTDDGDAGDPVLAVDRASGTVYLTGTSPRNAGWSGIPLWKSTDGGFSFGNPITVHGEITQTDKDWITVDDWAGTGQHDVYLGCLSANPAAYGLWLSLSTDGGGASWTSAPLSVREVANGTLLAESLIIQVGPNHVAYLFWLERTSDGTNWIKTRQALNRGATLGDIHTVVQLVTADSTLGNLALKRSNTAADDDWFRTFPFPVVGVNPDPSKTGHVYVAYADKGTSGDKADVFLVRSTDGGSSWTDPVRVSTVTNNDQWMPVLAVKPDGTKLFLAWYDRRNDSNNSLIDVYGRWASIATDGSVTLNTEFRITTTSFPPVFVGTLADNTIKGHYDPAYPPGGLNLHWWYTEWPAPPATDVTTPTYIDHVGEYNGAWSDASYVYMTWTDNRLQSVGTRYGRNQSDIRLLRLAWPQ